MDVRGFIQHTGKLVVRLFAYLSVADTLLSICKLLFAIYFLVICLHGLTRQHHVVVLLRVLSCQTSFIPGFYQEVCVSLVILVQHIALLFFCLFFCFNRHLILLWHFHTEQSLRREKHSLCIVL